MELKSNVPPGPIEQKWTNHKFDMKLVNPANKRKYSVIVVGIGPGGRLGGRLAGGAGLPGVLLLLPGQPAASTLDRRPGRDQRRQELSERRRQRLPAVLRHRQGGRLPRPRGQRLPPCRGLGQHHRPVRCAGRAVRPRIRRSAGEPVVRRRPGLANLLRPRPDRSAAPAGCLPGPCSARWAWARSRCSRGTRCRNWSSIDGQARGIVARDLETGAIESYAADAVILATGGYGTVFYLATYAKGCNTTAIWRAYKKGAAFANPCYTQIHPTCIPVTGDHQSKLTLMSESLRNDGRIWVPKKKGDTRPPGQIPEDERDYYLERKYPSYRQPVPPRHLLAGGQGGLRRGPRRGQDRAGRLSRFRRRDQPPRRRRPSASATATCSTCTSGSPTKTRTRCRCGSTPRCTTRWAGSGSTTT